jgi:hypothetical protein
VVVLAVVAADELALGAALLEEPEMALPTPPRIFETVLPTEVTTPEAAAPTGVGTLPTTAATVPVVLFTPLATLSTVPPKAFARVLGGVVAVGVDVV